MGLRFELWAKSARSPDVIASKREIGFWGAELDCSEYGQPEEEDEMYTYVDVPFETEVRKRELEVKLEQARRLTLAQAAHPRVNRSGGLHYLALWLGDILAGLQCQLRSRFAGPSSAG